jgi:hypothetical protein
LGQDGNNNHHHDEREYLTRPWLTEQLRGMPMMEFLTRRAEQDAKAKKSNKHSDESSSSLLLFLHPQHAQQFSPLEDRFAWDNGQVPRGSETVDIVPLRGSLVVFDSVQLPHQVEMIQSGTRLALAGWFHEKTQEFPEGFAGAIIG